jgi:hypothetical protein
LERDYGVEKSGRQIVQTDPCAEFTWIANFVAVWKLQLKEQRSSVSHMDIDSCIETIKTCKYLPESDMRQLCNKVLMQSRTIADIIRVDNSVE